MSRWLVFVLLAGCAVGPDYQRPSMPVDSYGVESQQVALGQEIPAQWWQLFHSAKLDETLKQVLAANHGLAAAQATLRQSHESVIEARAAFFPQLDLLAGARGATGIGGNLFSIGPTATYSVDAFGGTRRHVEQEEALEETQRYLLDATLITLTGNTVTEVIAIAFTRLQIATVQDLIQNDEKNLDLVQREFSAGKIAKSDVLTAQAQLASDRTLLPALHQQLSVARHALAVLAARAPGQWTPPDFDTDELTLPLPVPMSVPSELLRKRPDILAAEALLHAESAAIGVAAAQLYPSIVLTASLTRESTSLSGLFNSGGSNVLSGGGALDAPLFRGGALDAQKNAATDAYEAQLATYQQTVLQAFGQVADALSSLEDDAEMVAASKSATEIAADSVKLQRISFAAGKTTALQLIVAENTYSNSRLGYVRALSQQMNDVAQLFVAAGGGWWSEKPHG
jgi:NodT family efflux transporter outer membrane factor (OMF) lipoprotein